MDTVLSRVDAFLENLFVHRLPPLSPRVRDLLVQVIPWLVLLFVVLSIPGLLGVLGVRLFNATLTPAEASWWSVWFLLSLTQVILEIVALPYLFRRQGRGWRLLWYSTLLGTIWSLFTLAIIALLGNLIGLYVLYQIKDRYP